jgi:hypothetical protein
MKSWAPFRCWLTTRVCVCVCVSLQHLYEVTTTEITNSQQIYMMLIVLLMLSQQDEFGSTCQRVLLPHGERPLHMLTPSRP